MQHLYTARDAMDANFLCGLLTQEGVRAVVQGEALEGAWGNLNLSSESLPSVWVDEADVQIAAPIIEEYRRRDLLNSDTDDRRPQAARATWVCAHCGRRVEEQFTRCWHCGHDRKPE